MNYENSGATSAEWAHFAVVLGLTPDLLPVVSNQAAIIDPASSMKGLGKTPSRYRSGRRVMGFVGWTQHVSTDMDVRIWASEPDYGICLQTRNVRALDIDVDDAEEAAAILASLPPGLPRRIRRNSHKFLVAFILEGDYTKRKFATKHGIVEFLANGQQFICCGLHPSGVKYEWVGGLPDEFPVLTPEQFEEIWS